MRGGGGSQQAVKAEPMEVGEDDAELSCLSEKQLADFQDMDEV